MFTFRCYRARSAEFGSQIKSELKLKRFDSWLTAAIIPSPRPRSKNKFEYKSANRWRESDVIVLTSFHAIRFQLKLELKLNLIVLK